MSPILVRPVREQLEHDRVIRLLQAKFRRKYEAGINPGAEQNAAVGSGPTAMYPDLVLLSVDRGHRLQVVVEVETGESVNHLEALAEWAHFSKARAAFHLYVPAGMVDVARRLCEANHIYVSEIWSFHTVGDQVRFTLVHRNREAPPPQPRAPRPIAAPGPAASVRAATAAPSVRAAAAAPARSASPRASASARTAAPTRRPKAATRGAAKASPRKNTAVRKQKRK